VQLGGMGRGRGAEKQHDLFTVSTR
jgi:hypothetical protein